MTVCVVIGILAVMSVQVYSSIRAKAERAGCTNNLKNLFVAATAYVRDQNSWPQIPATDVKDPAYPLAWIAALRPYSISPVNWICPSTQYALGIDYNRFPRVDYFGTTFDDSPRAPFLYPKHPWFIERGDAHGDGNLVIFGNGQIRTLNEIISDARLGPGAP